jgi:hypothetical protein
VAFGIPFALRRPEKNFSVHF